MRDSNHADGEVVYTPESALKSPRALFVEMGRGLAESRHLALRLMLRNIKAQYRQSYLGYVWVVMPPLVTTALWVYLHTTRLVAFEAAEAVPYPVYVLTGMLLWQLFVDSLNAPLKAVGGSQRMLAKVNFPREALVLAALGEVAVDFGVRVVLFGLALAWFHVRIATTFWLAPVGILGLLVLGTAIGLLLVPLGTLYRDVGRGLGLGTQAWLYLTPVVYPVAGGSPLNWVNPVSPLLVTTRSLLIGGTHEFAGLALGIGGASFVLLCFAWVLYRIAMPFLIERMAA